MALASGNLLSGHRIQSSNPLGISILAAVCTMVYREEFGEFQGRSENQKEQGQSSPSSTQSLASDLPVSDSSGTPNTSPEHPQEHQVKRKKQTPSKSTSCAQKRGERLRVKGFSTRYRCDRCKKRNDACMIDPNDKGSACARCSEMKESCSHRQEALKNESSSSQETNGPDDEEKLQVESDPDSGDETNARASKRYKRT